MVKNEKTYPAYVWKYKSNREKQVILLIISNGEKWHYLVVKKLLGLLRGITSKNVAVIFIVRTVFIPLE